MSLAVLLCSASGAVDDTPTIQIPRVSRAPRLADFLENRPREAEAVVTDFRQFDPNDGTPVSQPTAAYLSYDDRNLYVVFVCKDDPALIRARLAKRKDIMADDRVTVNLDTFHDHKRAYFFDVNPYGVQMDGITTDGQGDDFSFETLWHTESKITDDGYIVLEAIPFRSLRFPDTPMQRWGITLLRFIQRNNEMSGWPHITRKRLPQFVAQFGDLEGLTGISPGRNMQMIPYVMGSRGTFLDHTVPNGSPFRTEGEVRGGADIKTVLNDAFTLDATINPDFSQVESDEPQVTINQRFEVFFPERRPFFTENAQFFETPEQLFFSRRIIDPQFGARLTGKVGRWAIGAIAADDRAAGRRVAADDPRAGQRASVGVLRVAREFGRQSHVGALVTDHEFGSGSNRVVSADTRIVLPGNWNLSGQAVRSETRTPGQPVLAGSALRVDLLQITRNHALRTQYIDRSPGFRTELGFVPRVDIRDLRQVAQYFWRPGGRIIRFGPTIRGLTNWNRQGRVQDWEVTPGFEIELPRLTTLSADFGRSYELYNGIGFRRTETEISGVTEWWKWLAIAGEWTRGQGINYYPVAGALPHAARYESIRASFTVRPTRRLRLDESYLYTRLSNGAPIFNNHIVRSKVNYQFNRALSLRTILDYSAVLPDASRVSLERSKRINGDFLITYLLHPGTALFIGYTRGWENYLYEAPSLHRTAFPGMPTGRQFFIKISYLIRP